MENRDGSKGAVEQATEGMTREQVTEGQSKEGGLTMNYDCLTEEEEALMKREEAQMRREMERYERKMFRISMAISIFALVASVVISLLKQSVK